MVAIGQVYNTADLPDGGSEVVKIDDGQYKAVIVSSDLIDNKNRTGKFLELKIVLIGGQAFADTEFTERLNIINNNQVAVDIAFRTLARISEAVGMSQTPSDSVQLHNKPFLINVVGEKSKDWTNKEGALVEGKVQSVIKKYLPLAGDGTQTVGGSPFAAQTVTPPQFVAAGANPPWKQ